MFNFFNNLGKYFVRLLLAVILIVAFAIWGIGDVFTSSNSTDVARLGDTTVTQSQFINAYQAIDRTQSTQHLSVEQKAQRALASTVSQAAIKNNVKDLNLIPSDEAVARYLREEIPRFQTDGKFSPALYKQFLKQARIPEQVYTQDIRDFLSQQIVQSAFAGTGAVYPSILKLMSKAKQEQRLITLYQVSPPKIDVGKPTQAQLQIIYKRYKPKGAFNIPVLRSVSYIELTQNDFTSDIKITNKEIQALYNKQKANLAMPGKRHVFQLISLDKKVLQGIEAALKKGGDFAKVAANYGYTAKDYDLGLIHPSLAFLGTRNALSATNNLKTGTVSNILPSPYGFQIIKVVNIEPKVIPPLAKVHDILKKRITAKKARTVFQGKLDKAEDLIGQGLSLAQISKDINAPIKTLDGISSKGINAKSSMVAGLPDTAFVLNVYKAKLKTTKGPIVTKRGDGFYLFRVTGEKPAYIKSFKDAQKQLTSAWEGHERKQILNKHIKQAVKDINHGVPSKKVLASLKTSPISLPMSSQDSPMLQRALPKDKIRWLFTIGKLHQATSWLIDGGGGIAVISKIRTIDAKEKESMEKMLSATMKSASQNELFNSFQQGVINSHQATFINNSLIKQFIAQQKG